MNAPQKTHDADDETLEYIADLEQRNAKIKREYYEAVELAGDILNRCRALELSARKSAEQAEELKAALMFYADEENYKAQLIAPDLVLIPVCDDRGDIARRALQNG